MKRITTFSILLLMFVGLTSSLSAQTIDLKLTVKNNSTSNLVASVPVQVIDGSGNKIADSKTDLMGALTLSLNSGDVKDPIMVEVTVPGYEVYTHTYTMKASNNDHTIYLKPVSNKTIDKTVKKGITHESKEVIMTK